MVTVQLSKQVSSECLSDQEGQLVRRLEIGNGGVKLDRTSIVDVSVDEAAERVALQPRRRVDCDAIIAERSA